MAVETHLQSWVMLEPVSTRQFRLLLVMLGLGVFVLVAVIAAFASGYWRRFATRGARALLDLSPLIYCLAFIVLAPTIQECLALYAPPVELRAPATSWALGDRLTVAWTVGGRPWQRALSRGMKCELVAKADQLMRERDSDGTRRTVEREVTIKKILLEPGSAGSSTTSGTASVLIPVDVPVTGLSKEWDGPVRWAVRCSVQTRWWPTPDDDFQIELRSRA